MTARQRFADELASLGDDEVRAYLSAHSGLPGPRGNLELLGAFGDVASPALIRRLADDEDEYLRCCGTAALGRLLLEVPDETAGEADDEASRRPASDGTDREASDESGEETLVATLTERARDPLWRVREGAAMAGQRVGAASPEALARLVGRWLDTGDPLVARAAVAAVCEPPILRPSPLLRIVALDACDRATGVLRAVPADHRRDPDVRTLRQGLAYCWSVAVAADPAAGLPRFATLATDPDPDVTRVVTENRKKNRLATLLRDREP